MNRVNWPHSFLFFYYTWFSLSFKIKCYSRTIKLTPCVICKYDIIDLIAWKYGSTRCIASIQRWWKGQKQEKRHQILFQVLLCVFSAFDAYMIILRVCLIFIIRTFMTFILHIWTLIVLHYLLVTSHAQDTINRTEYVHSWLNSHVGVDELYLIVLITLSNYPN